MKVVGNGGILTLSTDSVEGGIITVTNNGLSPLTNIQCILVIEKPDLIPIQDGSRVFQNATISTGSITYGVPNPGVADWSFPTLAPGASETLDIEILVVDASDVGAPWQVAIGVTMTEVDSDLTNNLINKTFNVISCTEIDVCVDSIIVAPKYIDKNDSAIQSPQPSIQVDLPIATSNGDYLLAVFHITSGDTLATFTVPPHWILLTDCRQIGIAATSVLYGFEAVNEPPFYDIPIVGSATVRTSVMRFTGTNIVVESALCGDFVDYNTDTNSVFPGTFTGSDKVLVFRSFISTGTNPPTPPELDLVFVSDAAYYTDNNLVAPGIIPEITYSVDFLVEGVSSTVVLRAN